MNELKMNDFKNWCDEHGYKYNNANALQTFLNVQMGKNVKIKLIELDKTQTWLADYLGVSKQLLNNVLQGRTKSLELEERIKSWLNQTKN